MPPANAQKGGHEMSKATRAEAIASLQRYFEENLSEPLGAFSGGLLLDFILEEISPIAYNRAIAEAQAQMQQRVLDLNGELFQEELRYWPRHDAKRRKSAVRK